MGEQRAESGEHVRDWLLSALRYPPSTCDPGYMSFVALIEIHLHFPDNHSLKGKRKEISHLRAQLQHRFGASVSETEHHDLWQRATLSVALVGSQAGVVSDAADKLSRFVDSQFPQGVRIDRALISGEEIFSGSGL